MINAQNPSYMLLRDANPAITYFHLMIKSKFPILLNATKKGNLKFTMPMHVKENLLNVIEERQSYCPN